MKPVWIVYKVDISIDEIRKYYTGIEIKGQYYSVLKNGVNIWILTLTNAFDPNATTCML